MSTYRGQTALWWASAALGLAHHLRVRLTRHRHRPAEETTHAR